MAETIVSNIVVKELSPIENDPQCQPFKEEFLKSLPINFKPHTLEFQLHDIDVSIANAIRRTIMGELLVKAFCVGSSDTDFKDQEASKTPQGVDTNEDYIIPADVIDRIGMIPINQNAKLNTKFSINVVNNTQQMMTVYSSDIKCADKTQKVIFTPSIQLAELHPGTWINIPNIKIEENYGYIRSKYSLTMLIAYDNLDIITIAVLNDKSNINAKRVSIDDLKKVMKELKFSKKEIEQLGPKSKILVIPKPEIATKDMNANEKEKLFSKYPIIIEAPVPECSSLTHQSRNFRLKIFTKGNIEPNKIIPIVCENLKNRLEKVKQIVHKIVQKQIPNGPVYYSLLVEGETHTIGELLRRHVFELDPSISNINISPDPFRNRNFYLNIVHSDAKKIITKACDKCIDTFSKISSSF